MRLTRFRSELNYLLPLVFSYASDYYQLSKYKDVKEALEKIGARNFANKCHEGFKLAQKRILRLLLQIENSRILLEDKAKNIRQTKNSKLLNQDKEYQHLLNSIQTLKFQEATIKEIANCIVWTLFKMDRISVKSLLQPDMHNKALKESNIKSLIKVANHFNRDENKFALISDLTSCVGLGDLIIVDTEKDSLHITEVKDGKINKIILDSLEKQDLDIAKEYLHNLPDLKAAKKFLMQFKRVLNQHEKSSNALNYIKTGVGNDLFTKSPKKTVETALIDETFEEVFFKVLEAFYAQEKEDELYFPLDSCIVAVIRNPNLSKKLNFQHWIYHEFIQPKSICPYTKHTRLPESLKIPEVVNHFKELRNIPLFNLKNKIFAVAHEPIFFNIPPKQAVDLFTNQLDIYIYFDHKRFFNLCKKNGLHPVWDNYEKNLKGESTYYRKNVVQFGGNCLKYGQENKPIIFTYGFLYRMVYELQTAKSVILQMKTLSQTL